MSRAFMWQPCNRLLEEQWRESELQQHRARLESIRTTNYSTTSTQVRRSFVSDLEYEPQVSIVIVCALVHQRALALTARGSSSSITDRLHSTTQSNSRTSASVSSSNANPVKLVARSQSPAAKARQKQIDRENLILIKKIVALDNSSHASSKPQSKTSKHKPKKNSTSSRQTHAGTNNHRNTIVVPAQNHNYCLQQDNPLLPDVPPAACHPLYTHNSATMRNNFADTNGSTLRFITSGNKCTQVQIQDENKKLLQRILSARKSYSRTQWSEQERKRRKLLRNISRHHQSQQPQPQQQQHAASTSRLPSCNAPDAYTTEFRMDTGRNSPRRHNSSSEELISTEALGIRLLSTTHLKAPQQQKQRSLSASAANRSSVASRGGHLVSNAINSWASPTSARQPVASCRKPASESIVQRMRSMTLERHEYECTGADDKDDEEANGQDLNGGDEDEDESEALLQDLS